MFRRELWKKVQAAVVAAAVALSPVVMPVTSYASETETTAEAETTTEAESTTESESTTEAESTTESESTTEAESTTGTESTTETQPETSEETTTTAEETTKVEEAAVTISVNLTKNTPATDYQLTVKSTDAEKYGFTKPESDKNKVTILDALADIHAIMYGADKVKDELKVTDKGWITNCFGSDKGNVGYAIDDTTPSDVFAELKTDNTLYLYLYNDTVGWSDKFLYFGEKTTKSCIHKDIVLTVNTNGYDANWNMVKTPVNGATVELRDEDDKTIASATTDESGEVTLKAEKEGTYTAVITKSDYEYYNPTNAKVIVEDEFGDWVTKSEATVFAPAVQARTCAGCGLEETREVGDKLTPILKVNPSAVTLDPDKGTCNIDLRMANGDSVKEWKSADPDIVEVSEEGKLTAGTKEGKTTVTVTLASGKKATIKVTVAHDFSDWEVKSEATVFAPEVQVRACGSCGLEETREVGEKLTPTIKIDHESVTMEPNYSTSKIVVSDLANGDSVKSFKSANTKIVTVDKDGKLTSGIQTGTTTVTVTLASGKTAKVTVNVTHHYGEWKTIREANVFQTGIQTRTCAECGDVETIETEKPVSKIVLSKSSVTFEPNKGTYTVEIDQDQFGKGDSVKSWKSADTKIVTVDKNGKLTPGSKTGKTTVTVTLASGKTAKVTVTVAHKFSAWKVTKKPTLFDTGVQTRTCAVCKKVETKKINKLVAPSVTLEPKKGKFIIRISGIAKGDYITSWKSANTSIVKVASNGMLTAGSKTGKTYVTVTLKSKKSAKITVYVAHTYSAWKTIKKATVFAPAKQQRKCEMGGEVQTRNYGKKLSPTIKVNASTVTLQTRQSTTAVKVTGLASGDSIKSWKSANTSIVKVASNGKLTAGSKTGKTTVTVTLKSGKTAKITVNVQKTTVKTTGITGVPKTVSLAAGKSYTLKPAVSPITSQEKITYKSANTKIATVDAKGVITAKTAGTVNVTVQSGTKKAVVAVTVKK